MLGMHSMRRGSRVQAVLPGAYSRAAGARAGAAPHQHKRAEHHHQRLHRVKEHLRQLFVHLALRRMVGGQLLKGDRGLGFRGG